MKMNKIEELEHFISYISTRTQQMFKYTGLSDDVRVIDTGRYVKFIVKYGKKKDEVQEDA